MIPYKNDVIFILGMCVQNIKKICVFLFFSVCAAVIFIGCDAIDTLLPYTGTYKINININSTPLDECSYAKQSDKIIPYFADPVSNDPDVTALMVFLKDSKEEIVGWKVLYNLDIDVEEIEKNDKSKETISDKKETTTGKNESDGKTPTEEIVEEIKETDEKVTVPAGLKDGEELIISVSSLDKELPSFPIPKDLPVGRYTLVSQVMSGKDVLQKTEKTFFYLGNTIFSYKGINAYLPGIADSLQLIPKGTVVMLEADMVFDKKIDPYIIWYDGKNKIKEGNYSNGLRQIFWEAPELSGFFSLRAEIFPYDDYKELTGYKKEISLLVSSKEIDLHLISENISQLEYWYKFEAGLRDSKMPASLEREIKQIAGNNLKWKGINGTYGLASGYGSVFNLPKTSIQNKYNDWQVLFRLNSINSGGVFSIIFDPLASGSVRMHFYIEGGNLILVLTSPLKTVSQTVNLSALSVEIPESDLAEHNVSELLTIGVTFSVIPDLLKAQINIAGQIIDSKLAPKPIFLETKIKNEFQIMLGFLNEFLTVHQNQPADESALFSENSKVKTENDQDSSLPEITAVWDEFALYYMPPMDILAEEISTLINEEQPVADAES